MQYHRMTVNLGKEQVKQLRLLGMFEPMNISDLLRTLLDNYLDSRIENINDYKKEI